MTTKYGEILRLSSKGFSRRNIALSVPCSRNTVAKVVNRAGEIGISWPLPDGMTEQELSKKLFDQEEKEPKTTRRMPNYEYVRKELLKNGVNKKLLWTEYLEECKQCGEQPLMYSQFCYYIQQDEKKRRASAHIPRKPGEQIEVDWAGDSAYVIDPNTGEAVEAKIFVGVLTYSQYAYVEAFPDEKTPSWINAHVHMFEYFGGVAKILVPDNTTTAVTHKGGWYTQELNKTYRELAEHYGTAVIPARVRKPKDKPNVEGNVGHVSTWIVAALRNEQFFSFEELNASIRVKLENYNAAHFQKKDGSRKSLFEEEESPLLLALPMNQYELAEWKEATVLFNYHVSFDDMYYSVPAERLNDKVDLRITARTIEVFYNQERIASHKRLYGRKGQYSTVTEHMPADHQWYFEWNGDRFRKWAKSIGENTFQVVDAMLTTAKVEQQAYRNCMGLLKLADRHSKSKLDQACAKALEYTASPSYKAVKNILVAAKLTGDEDQGQKKINQYGVTRGADYYKR